MTVTLDAPNLPGVVRAVLQADRAGTVAAVFGLLALLACWAGRAVPVAALRGLLLALVRLGTRELSHAAAIACVGTVWGAVAIPFIWSGPPDFEEYLTGVTTTKLAVDGLSSGAWPFWSTSLGLGTPLPLRYHFLTHPLAPACAVYDCHAVLRVVTALHLLLGAACLGALAFRLTRHRMLSALAAVTFLLSSSVVQPLLTDDWPLTGFGESTFPVLLLLAHALVTAVSARRRLAATLALGGMAGLWASLSFPAVPLVILALIALALPGAWRRLPWFVLAGALAAFIGGAQLLHIAEETLRNPAGMARADHPDFRLTQHLWSMLARPLPVDGATMNWRSAFWGPPFAVLALGALAGVWASPPRWVRVGFLIGVAGLIIPPAWLFDLQTATWTYRIYLNLFGILLAVIALAGWAGTPRERLLGVLSTVQILWMLWAISGPWLMVAQPVWGVDRDARHRLRSPGIAEQIAADAGAHPGRVAFAPRADQMTKEDRFNQSGLAANQLALLGVPVLTAYAWGDTMDEVSPQLAMLQAEVHAPGAGLVNQAWLDVLGVRYVLAMPDDVVAPGLRERRTFARGLRLLENPSAWPQAFFVTSPPASVIPRLADCGHDRFVCADFGRAGFARSADAVTAESVGDGFRLSFAPAGAPRLLILTQWFRPGWRVMEGRARVAEAAEHFVGVTVEAGESAVTVRFRPPVRMALFAAGVLAQWAALLGAALLWRLSAPEEANAAGLSRRHRAHSAG